MTPPAWPRLSSTKPSPLVPSGTSRGYGSGSASATFAPCSQRSCACQMRPSLVVVHPAGAGSSGVLRWNETVSAPTTTAWAIGAPRCSRSQDVVSTRTARSTVHSPWSARGGGSDRRFAFPGHGSRANQLPRCWARSADGAVTVRCLLDIAYLTPRDLSVTEELIFRSGTFLPIPDGVNEADGVVGPWAQFEVGALDLVSALFLASMASMPDVSVTLDGECHD
jgi:hypothetical protein